MSDGGRVVVGAAPDGIIGAIMATALESAGVPVEVRSTGHGWLYPGAGTSGGSVELLVPASCAADARAILSGLDAGAVDDPDAGR